MVERASALQGHRVVLVSQLPPPVHGSAMMTIHLRDALVSAGARVDVVDKRFSRTADDVGAMRVGKLLAVPGLLRRLVRTVRAGRPEVCVYFLTCRPPSFLVDVTALLVLRLLRVPVVLYLHTSGYGALAARGRLWRRLVSGVLRSGLRVVTLGPRLLPDIAALVPRERVELIANTAGAISPALPTNAPGFRVLFLSNLLPEKGVDAYLRMAAQLVAQHPEVDWRFDVAGAGSPERLAAVVAFGDAWGLNDRLAVHGSVGPDAKWQLLAAASLLVFPSTYAFEAQPLTIVECLATGTPVVAYDIGGVGDLVVDGSSGVLVPAGDEQALVTAVERLQRDAHLLMALDRGALERHALAHSAHAYRDNWVRVLDEVGGEHR